MKSEVSTKNPDVEFTAETFKISAETRGKELKVILQDENELKNSMKILFRFGMSGCFQLTSVCSLPKHAHLQFYTQGGEPMVLSFVDYRRFGRWEVDGDWGKDRGPDPILEYDLFRQNVLDNLDKSDFQHPICEVLLNQKYFNGIGNYLRAEILYRGGVPPFSLAKDVLFPLLTETKVKSESADLLSLCNIIPKEVLDLEQGKVYNSDDSSKKSQDTFSSWLQCYYVAGMDNLKDSNGRTIWFSGEAGEMKPKNAKSVGVKGGPGSKVPVSGKEVEEPKVRVKEEMKDELIKTHVKKVEKEGRKTKKSIKQEEVEDNIIKTPAKKVGKEEKKTKKNIKREVKVKIEGIESKRPRRTASSKSSNFYTES